MALTRGFIRNAVTTPLDARLMDMARVVSNADGSPRPGVLGVLGGPLLTALATMAVAIAAAPFVTTKGKADGVAIFTNDGTVNVAIAAAPVANSRIDVIWVKHNDDTTGDATSTPVFGVTAGAAAASPTKPAIPTGALELGTLRVYAGTTAANGAPNTLMQTYQMTAMQGGVVPMRTLAELNTWTTATVGQLARVIDPVNSGTFAWSGTAWGDALRVATYNLVINGLADASLRGSAIPTTPVPSETTDESFITARTGTACTVKRGLYHVTMSFALSGTAFVFTGRTFAEVTYGTPGVGTTVVARANGAPGVGEDTLSCSVVVYVPTDGGVITGQAYKVSGSSATIFTGRLTIAKLF